MPDEIRVEPAVLDAGALAMVDLRETLLKDVTDVTPETEQAARDLAGWSTALAVENLLWFWRDDLRKLAAQFESGTDGLRGCARDYRQTDHASAEHFRAAGGW
ncbi:hypothetical protein [Micromonospora zhanjiangensis]|uniref:Excreted virulence factor EspC, type VII ESX diderm n=1 Tax=Micromonospora zhanjiangensis TaxID=1522057 RepID=A0ABV8KXP6_9ACTN